MRNPALMTRWLWLAVMVVVLDQVSKLWIVAHFSEQESLPVVPFFNLVLVYNQGAAFSFLSSAGGWQRWFFVALALLISWVLVRWLSRLEVGEYLSAAAYALILGGAWGNLIDRLYQGRVTDFIDLYYQQWHWPAFNLADSAILLGVLLLLVGLWQGEQKGT